VKKSYGELRQKVAVLQRRKAVTDRDAPGRTLSLVSLLDFVPYVSLVVLFIGASFVSPSFLNVHNLLNVAQTSAVLGFVAVGSAIVLISGCLDLSVGAIMGAGAMACFAVQSAGAPVAIAVGLGVGAGLGAVNGLLVGLLGVNSLLATLGMSSIVSGGLLVLSNAVFMTGTNTTIRQLGQSSIAGVPISVGVFVLVLVILTYWTRRLASGHAISAVGANPRASFASGLAVPRIRFYCFVVSGLLAAMGGIVLAGRVDSAYSSMGTTYTFEAITAAVLGGVSLFGGIGSVIRATIGVLVLALLTNIMDLLGAPIVSQLVVEGILFIGIVALDGVARRHAK
jgi:ribose/xylose/arabinose/galactoside ABC-type transport system permease subunit